MTEPRNETQLTKRITDAVAKRYPAIWQLKTHGSGYQRAGVPDLLLCVSGRLLAVEVKHRKPGESTAAMLSRVSPRQHVELDALHRAGASTMVAWSVEQVMDRIEELELPA